MNELKIIWKLFFIVSDDVFAEKLFKNSLTLNKCGSFCRRSSLYLIQLHWQITLKYRVFWGEISDNARVIKTFISEYFIAVGSISLAECEQFDPYLVSEF